MKFLKSQILGLIAPLKNTEQATKKTVIPWRQKLVEPTSRLLYAKKEYPAVARLRNLELLNPAPFSKRTLIHYGLDRSDFESPVNFSNYSDTALPDYYDDVPVINIIGAYTTNNMACWVKGMTYREVLFEALHGAGIYQEGLDFLASNRCKKEDMPHKVVENDRKTRSTKELYFYKYGDYYISGNGHQRTIFAMFHNWQEEGEKGTVKNVLVKEMKPLLKSAQCL